MSTPEEKKDTGSERPSVNLSVRLQNTDDADQPVFSNFTVVQGDGRIVFVDFGFIEPSAVPNAARIAGQGGEAPGEIPGKLASRVVLGVESAMQLVQQLDRHLKAVAARTASARDDSGTN